MQPRAMPLAILLLAAPLAGHAQNNDKPGAQAPASAPAGSSSFCLHELPSKDGVTRFVNLGIVQYVELTRERVRITYGGGNFGSGFDADIPVKSREEGLETIKRIQQTARECARHMMGPGPMNGMGGMNGMGMRGNGAPNGSPADAPPPQNNGR